MAVQIVRPHSIGVASGGARRAVLLMGASGVVGRAVPGRLHDFDVVCPVHRSPSFGPNVTAVPGDVATLRSTLRYWAAQAGYGQAEIQRVA